MTSLARFTRLFMVVLLAPVAGAATGGFARLADGTIVQAQDRAGGQLTYERADGTPGQVAIGEVDGWLEARQADRLVDGILPKVGIREKHGEIRKELSRLQMAAVPRIVHHLQTGDERKRMEAIAALQFVWSRAAEDPVKAATKDENESIRRIALRLVQKHIRGDHAELVEEAAEDASAQVSGPALAVLLMEKPDPKRLAEALEDRNRWPYLHALLPRYHDQARLGEVTHRMLESGRPDEQASALCALIHQYDLAGNTAAKVRGFLRNPDPALRMRAAEYLRWHGGAEGREDLEAARKAERDPHCRAVLAAAIAAIERRHRLFVPGDGPTAPEWPGDFAKASRAALTTWANEPVTAPLRTATFELLRTRPFVPYFIYRGDEENETNEQPLEERYLRLVIRATGYPARSEIRHDRSGGEAPETRTLMAPTRDYFDPQRHSFGLRVGDDGGPFANSCHVGDDVAGRRQHESVVAIGDGIVRHARVASPSWGGIVIIEHRDPSTDQRYCSLYSHLGPLLCVQPGERVRKGDMLGSLGQDYTLATGGYASHLHFGIHLSPYDDPEVPASQGWITGYLSPERFQSGKHAWTDPQPFIRERLK